MDLAISQFLAACGGQTVATATGRPAAVVGAKESFGLLVRQQVQSGSEIASVAPDAAVAPLGGASPAKGSAGTGAVQGPADKEEVETVRAEERSFDLLSPDFAAIRMSPAVGSPDVGANSGKAGQVAPKTTSGVPILEGADGAKNLGLPLQSGADGRGTAVGSGTTSASFGDTRTTARKDAGAGIGVGTDTGTGTGRRGVIGLFSADRSILCTHQAACSGDRGDTHGRTRDVECSSDQRLAGSGWRREE